jgi:NAD-reducing hydrogenase large subunit
VTRVEGHGKVTILLDDRGRSPRPGCTSSSSAASSASSRAGPSGSARLVQRLCGICPVSHHLCAAKAIDRIVGGENLTPTAEKMRRLMHYGQFFQSHALHFFHLCSPDLLFGFDADVGAAQRDRVAAKHPDLAVQGVLMRKYGQEIIKVTAGKKIHGTGRDPGRHQQEPLDRGARRAPEVEFDQILEWSRGALKVAKDYTVENLEEVKDFGSFDSNHLCIVRDDGAMDLYHGGLRAIDATARRSSTTSITRTTSTTSSRRCGPGRT